MSSCVEEFGYNKEICLFFSLTIFKLLSLANFKYFKKQIWNVLIKRILDVNLRWTQHIKQNDPNY